MTDFELLCHYLDGSAVAFAELVNRHAGWVYAVARRRLRDTHLAEDVTQSVFLVLARKAHRLRRGTVLSAWLFEVTRMTVLRLQRDAVRRRRREVESAALSISAKDEHAEAWRALEPVLDQSVGRLRDRDRQAILLRFYERKTFAEVGQALGASEEAARKCVARAVDRLRAMLAPHAVTVSAPALVAPALSVMLWEGASQSAGLSLATTPLGTAALAKTILAEQSRLSVLELAKGAILMMAWKKARLALLSAAATAFLATVGVAIIQRPAARADAPATAPALTILQAAPILPVKDLAVSVDFYTSKLGFEKMWDFGEPASIVCVGRNQTCIYLSQAGEGARGTSVYLQVSDVDVMRREIAANGVVPIEEPVDRQWGMREMIVEDPDGHQLRIGSIYDKRILPSERRK